MPQVFGDVTVEVDVAHVATVTIHRPPDNYFDVELIGSIADAYGYLDAGGDARAIVLRSEGKHFCAGARLGGPRPGDRGAPAGPHLYDEAVRIFECALPVVAAIQGGAIGGGLGLALSADFRVGSPQARMSANFAKLGFHHGFALTVTLPRVVGHQRANELLLRATRLDGEAAQRIGLLDRLVVLDDLESATHEFAADIAASAPLAVRGIRATMRDGLLEQIRAATARERAEQDRLTCTADFAEGVAAMRERRPPVFGGS